MVRRGSGFVALIVLGVACIGVSGAGGVATRSHSSSSSSVQVVRAAELVGVPLPAPGALAPSPAARLFPTALPRHIVLGFIGANGFSGVSSTELADVSEVVTNMTNVTATGALSTSTPGWTDLNDPDFPSFVTAAHRAGDRVLLGIANGSSAALVTMLRHPANGATRLARVVTPIVLTDHLDGIDLDIEGGPTAERGAFTTFAMVLERSLARAVGGGELVVNVAPSSASTQGFFNVRALAAIASALFLMDYDMTPGGVAGPNAPLVTSTPLTSDLSSLLAYASAVPAAKLILGIPFYGYDFPTKTSAPGSAVTGLAQSVTYDDIVAVGHVGHWDATSLTPYYVFRRGMQWHETYYDDPVSVALKTALASVFRLLGVGVWSLGQEGPSSAMLAALDGGAAPQRVSIIGR